MAGRRVREIVRIDEEKCTGCGLCVPACAEGAIQIIDGKARLVSEIYCDGLGACLGHCPEDAITIERRQAEEFDEKAVEQHLEQTGRPAAHSHAAEAKAPAACPSAQPRRLQEAPHEHGGVACPSARPQTLHAGHSGGGCPSARVSVLGDRGRALASADEPRGASRSELRSWPVQLALVPPRAPMFEDADLLISADCVPFAYPDFHRKLLRGNTVVVGCPKLDDVEPYIEKLTQIIVHNDIRSITVAHMEVPCCFGLVRVVEEALARSGRNLGYDDVTITLQGERHDRSLAPAEA